jgi:hypothetical protein
MLPVVVDEVGIGETSGPATAAPLRRAERASVAAEDRLRRRWGVVRCDSLMVRVRGKSGGRVWAKAEKREVGGGGRVLAD